MSNTIPEASAARDASFPIGAHVVARRRWYTHHGIYVGGEQVVHYAGLSSSLRRGLVTKISLAEFGRGQPVHVQGEEYASYAGIDVAARALSRLGEDAYDVLRNNCEHFCSWCLFGIARSAQVEHLLSGSPLLAIAAQLLASLVDLLSSARGRSPIAR